MSIEVERVGPVFYACPDALSVIDAIRKLNSDVEILDRESYFRVLVPKKCVVTKEAIEDSLKKPFQIPGDLEMIMPSFQGKMTISDNQIVWESGEAQ